MVKIHISTELFFSTAFVVLSVVFTDLYGLVGVTYAHTVNYVLYLICMISVTRYYFKTIPSE